ncbi:hypothetical protein [Amycolatopsis thermoflava]|uniref:hypothetical protein n=1 Tax=Amycolatopsis thermoflava TaxID=84480 RepID=UPI0022B265DA|nr:hypothetical protein [Amycolatopsis thermoflava]
MRSWDERTGNGGPARHRPCRMWVKVIEAGIAEGTFRDDLGPKLTYQFLRDAIWVAVRWFTPSGRLSVDQLADQYLKLVMEGLETGR